MEALGLAKFLTCGSGKVALIPTSVQRNFAHLRVSKNCD